jgi:hypothetical protein
MTLTRSFGATCLAGMILFGLTTSASAHPVYRSDPQNDVMGKTNLKGMSFDHGDGRTYLLLRTHHPLQRAHLNNGNFLYEGLDTRRNDNIDFLIYMEFRDGPNRYFCFIFRRNQTLVRRVRADKRESAIGCDFRSSLVRGVAEHYEGHAFYDGQFDFIPNNQDPAVHWGGGAY